MTVTKAEIVEAIYNELEYPHRTCVDIVETLLEIMKETLEGGEDILISGFGKFCVNNKSRRKGRNPATGEEMMLDKRRVVTFRYSSGLRELINQQ